MLALAGELLDRHELLLHRQELRAEVAAQLHQVSLLRGERLLHGADGGQDGIPLRRPHRIASGRIAPKGLHLELDFPDVPFQGAAGDEPQRQDQRVTAGGDCRRHR